MVPLMHARLVYVCGTGKGSFVAVKDENALPHPGTVQGGIQAVQSRPKDYLVVHFHLYTPNKQPMRRFAPCLEVQPAESVLYI